MSSAIPVAATRYDNGVWRDLSDGLTQMIRRIQLPVVFLHTYDPVRLQVQGNKGTATTSFRARGAQKKSINCYIGWL